MGRIQLRSRGTATRLGSAEAGESFRVAPVGDIGSDLYEPPDGFPSIVTGLRWVTTTVALLVLSTGSPTTTDAVVGAGVLTYALCRTIWPLRATRRRGRATVAVLGEAVVMVTAIVATGYWDSPYVFGVVTVISAAGFAGGTVPAIQAAGGCFFAIALPYHVLTRSPSIKLTVQWAGELLLIAMFAAYARRMALEGRAETSRFLGRLRQLSDMNALLLRLHRSAERLPMSLDLGETLDSSVAQLRELFEADVLILLLREDELWVVARCVGAALESPLSTARLPSVLQEATQTTSPQLVDLAPPDDGRALNLTSRSGIYAALVARGDLTGMVGLERTGDDPFTPRHVSLMEGFAQQMAMAVDNARWFTRIGTLAAEQERSRIARDLHDRVGQSLASVGFELDRVARKASDPSFARELVDLREHVRNVVRELRETLSDLRTDVSEERDLRSTLEDFLERVRRRSSLAVELEARSSRRLPLMVEREVWRIAQEAIFNAERHAGASSVKVIWTSDAEAAELQVVDDGAGIDSGVSRTDGHGLLGMHERAQAIGASLSISSSPGNGTTVRLTLAQ